MNTDFINTMQKVIVDAAKRYVGGDKSAINLLQPLLDGGYISITLFDVGGGYIRFNDGTANPKTLT